MATYQGSTDLKGMVRHIKPAATWKDLAYSQGILPKIRNICRDFISGKGFVCLFAGASGTGKAMVAEVIANQLRLDLLSINLGAVVSKYVGETEKNLDRIFQEAEESGAILFFDEADSLFGQRSEVKGSHTRYANIDIDYLLECIQANPYLFILATNKKHAMDAALLRRFRYIIDFQ